MNHAAEQLRLLLPFYNEDIHLFARKDIQAVGDLVWQAGCHGDAGQWELDHGA